MKESSEIISTLIFDIYKHKYANAYLAKKPIFTNEINAFSLDCFVFLYRLDNRNP